MREGGRVGSGARAASRPASGQARGTVPSCAGLGPWRSESPSAPLQDRARPGRTGVALRAAPCCRGPAPRKPPQPVSIRGGAGRGVPEGAAAAAEPRARGEQRPGAPAPRAAAVDTGGGSSGSLWSPPGCAGGWAGGRLRGGSPRAAPGWGQRLPGRPGCSASPGSVSQRGRVQGWGGCKVFGCFYRRY